MAKLKIEHEEQEWWQFHLSNVQINIILQQVLTAAYQAGERNLRMAEVVKRMPPLARHRDEILRFRDYYQVPKPYYKYYARLWRQSHPKMRTVLRKRKKPT